MSRTPLTKYQYVTYDTGDGYIREGLEPHEEGTWYQVADVDPLLARVEQLEATIQKWVAYYDKQEGTPCEQIRHEDQVADLKSQHAALLTRHAALEQELNTPEILDFAKAVNLEAAHQRERWGTDHDGGKTDADWFWLVGYLAGKALHLPEKRLHHLITAAAALANWHLYSVGKTTMRPGIEPPDAAAQETP